MATNQSKDSFGTQTTMDTGLGRADYFRLSKLEEDGLGQISRLPLSIKVLLEAVLRGEDGLAVTKDDIGKLASYDARNPAKVEIPFLPARVLMQDFTGVPAMVDLAALRDATQRLGGDPRKINPLTPVNLIIDHSVQVDRYGSPDALAFNAQKEFERNRERYEFLAWSQKAFDNLEVVPPASGICHQVNLEHIAQVVVYRQEADRAIVFPDSLVGMDSHTPMINGLGVVGWGVGGIEAEAAMLGQPIYMLLPSVIGIRITGQLPPGAMATDAALTVTRMLREKGVVGKFVEFFGPGISSMSLPDRATISNMAPEYGATLSYFPVDQETLDYLLLTGRGPKQVELVEQYCKEQGLFRTDDSPAPQFEEIFELDLNQVRPSLAGPKRPQDRIDLDQMKKHWTKNLRAPEAERGFALTPEQAKQKATVKYQDGAVGELGHGDVVIAAITSCTSTSNPVMMLGAGLLAKKACEKGLTVSPQVKTSLAPGSKVVTEYLVRSGLLPYLEKLGFHIVGYGCTTCIGNSGPLSAEVEQAIADGSLVVASVLSGNRNFEGRISQSIKANYLASPPLVVAYALAGNMEFDLTVDPLGTSPDGNKVYLKDIWPSNQDIRQTLKVSVDPSMYQRVYSLLSTSNETWNAIPATGGALFDWQEQSTYIQQPPFFTDLEMATQPIAPISKARVLVKVGDSITTDHISPAGAIAADSPAGNFLQEQGVAVLDFNSYGSRRGNDRVMIRGTFANIRMRNQMAAGTEGGWTTHLPTGEMVSIHEASARYLKAGTPTLVLAGKDYGMGSSRDWAAKGTFLLGVRAVLAQSFERIHRSNLVGMGVLPLQFKDGDSIQSLDLTGRETYSIHLDDDLKPGTDLEVAITGEDQTSRTITVLCRIDSPIEVEYYRNGGILPTVLRRILAESEDIDSGSDYMI